MRPSGGGLTHTDHSQIGDHAEARMIHQIRSGVIEDAFQNRGCDQGIGNNGPGIMEVCGDKFLEIDGVTRARNSEEPDMLGTR